MHSPFVFDVYLPPNYPHAPPLVHYCSVLNERFHPVRSLLHHQTFLILRLLSLTQFRELSASELVRDREGLLYVAPPTISLVVVARDHQLMPTTHGCAHSRTQ